MQPVIWNIALFATFVYSPCIVIGNHLHSRSFGKPKAERRVCNTQECEELAQVLVESMNRSVNPCEDFYEYACGNWAKNNPLPKDQTRWNLLYKTQKKVDDRLKEMLEDEAKPEDVYASRVARRALKACMDIDKKEKEGLQPFISTMWSVGGWPLIMEENEWDEKMYSWQNVDDYYALLTGVNSFHDVHIDVDFLNGFKLVPMISTPHLPNKIYKIYVLDEYDADSSDENNDSSEGSQEPGSEERKEPEGSGNNDDDDEDRYEALRRINNHKIHKRRNNKEHVNNRKIKHHLKKNPIQVLNKNRHKSTRYSETSNKKNRYEGEDMYFANTYYEKNSKISEENDEENDNGENSEDNESDRQDYSSSGDYEWDPEDDSDDEDDDDATSKETDKSKGEAKKEVEEARRKYAEYMLNVSIALSEARGVPIPRERLMRDIADLISFQVKLIKYVYSPGEMMNTKLRLFQEKYDSLANTSNSKVNWVRKVQDLFSHGGMEINKNDVAIIWGYKYFKNLRTLLDTTPKRTLVNYIHWNFLSRLTKASTKKMRDLYYDWDGTEIYDDTRLKYCIDEINIDYILGYEYVKRYFPDKILETASDMISDIQKEVEYEVKKATWMDDEIRHILLDKLMYMKSVIGYPDTYRNSTIVNNYLKGLSVTQSHYENTLSFMRYHKMQTLRMIITQDMSIDRSTNPLIVNAFFSAFRNTLEVTAADFQKPVFDFKQPWYTNYGAMGLIMSHEVNHGFDVLGRGADKSGRLIIWSPEMTKEYEKRAKCFMDQFTKYSVVDKKTANIAMKDYGKRTAGENIADSMGLKAVYKAYERRLRQCDEPDMMLPGLEKLSNEQLFFLSFAYMWCEVADPEELPKVLKYDSHSPGPLRVIGSISNNKDFAKAYNCPLGSPMNPKKKCNLWE